MPIGVVRRLDYGQLLYIFPERLFLWPTSVYSLWILE